MNELSLFVLELAENSAEAGADFVEIKILSASDNAEIIVSDNGAGMTAEQVQRAAALGYTTKGARRGRGLCVIKAAAEKTGGELLIRSNAGEGTTVRVKFIKNEYCPPMGDINSVIRLLAVCRSDADFYFEIKQSNKKMTFDTRVIKQRLAPALITSSTAAVWIREYLQEQTKLIFGGAAMKSLAELQAIREKTRLQLNLRHESPDNISVRVGLATCGIEAGAREVICAFVDELADRGIENVTVTAMGCIDKCDKEPIVEVQEPGGEVVTYVNMTPEKAVKVIEEHIINKQVVAEYTDGAAV